MKKTLPFLFILFSFWSSAQEYELSEYLFVRIYDATGKKINKGGLLAINNQGLRLEEKDSIVGVPVGSIGEIRTKHTFGGKILIGSLVGCSVGLGMIAGDPEFELSSQFSGEERIVAVTGGAVIGGLVGVGIGLLQKRSKYVINGEAAKLQVFAKALQK